MFKFTAKKVIFLRLRELKGFRKQMVNRGRLWAKTVIYLEFVEQLHDIFTLQLHCDLRIRSCFSLTSS